MQSVLQSTTGIGPEPVQPDDLSGRTAVVVGGAFGIGFEVSLALAGAGCRVLMVNQKQEQGEDARATIEEVIKENEDDILAVSLHPGAVNTAMQQQWKDAYPGLTGKLLIWAMLAFGRDVKQGSYSALWALTSDKVQNGWYDSDPDQPGKESSQASDPNLGPALWDLSHRIIREKLGEDALVDWMACA
ncbi:hypothetical protein VTG60DRAFT_4080 [Thermothelomyces hinnuleus]